MLQLAC